MKTMKKLDINIDNKSTSFIGYIIDDDKIFIELDVLNKLSKTENEIDDDVLKINTDIDWIDIPINETIIIDFGHGGKDGGAVDGVDENNDDYINTLEKDLNRIIGKKLGLKLTNLGINVLYTRKEDENVSLKTRTDYANTTSAKLYLSIHFNAGNEKAKGIETFKYINTSNPLSHKFAKNLQSELINATEFIDRGVKESSFWVLKHTKMAACLVELGFITNNEEEKVLHTEEFQDKVSNALANAVILTLNNI